MGATVTFPIPLGTVAHPSLTSVPGQSDHSSSFKLPPNTHPLKVSWGGGHSIICVSRVLCADLVNLTEPEGDCRLVTHQLQPTDSEPFPSLNSRCLAHGRCPNICTGYTHERPIQRTNLQPGVSSAQSKQSLTKSFFCTNLQPLKNK